MPSIDCKNMPTQKALRIFKRKCDNAGIVLEVRKRQSYEKPSAKRQRLKKRCAKTQSKGIKQDKITSFRGKEEG